MSLVNVWVSPERAFVGVDTQCIRPDGGRFEGSKMVPLVHANLILVTRGHLDFMNALFAICYSLGGDFDDLSSGMLGTLAAAFNLLSTHAPEREGVNRKDLEQQEAYIVGWSRKEGRMLARRYRQAMAEEGFVRGDIAPLTVNPWEGAPGAIPPLPNTVEGLEKAAHMQATFTHGPNSEPMVGGRLLVAELTRDTMTITSRCHLGARNQPMNALQ